MAVSKIQARKTAQSVNIGETVKTDLLDVANTEVTITFNSVAEKVSFQASDTLAGDVTFSLDGQNFGNTTAIGGANAIVSFNTHNIRVIKVTRSGGSGKLTIAAK